jgi:hypothetical protein
MPMSIVEYTFLGPFSLISIHCCFGIYCWEFKRKKWFLIKPFYFDKVFSFFLYVVIGFLMLDLCFYNYDLDVMLCTPMQEQQMSMSL